MSVTFGTSRGHRCHYLRIPSRGLFFHRTEGSGLSPTVRVTVDRHRTEIWPTRALGVSTCRFVNTQTLGGPELTKLGLYQLQGLPHIHWMHGN